MINECNGAMVISIVRVTASYFSDARISEGKPPFLTECHDPSSQLLQKVVFACYLGSGSVHFTYQDDSSVSF